jgi:hypothetical protein
VAEIARDTKWLKNGGEVIKNLKNVSVVDLIEMTANGDINPKLGSDLVAWKTDPDSPQYETDESAWNEIVATSLRPELDLREFQTTIGRAIANKDIQADEGAEFVAQVGTLFEKAVEFKAQRTRRAKNIATVVNMFKSIMPFGFLSPDMSLFNMTKELFNRITGKDDGEISSIAKEIVTEEIKSHNPELSTLEEIPTSIMDNTKGFKNISNQGSNFEADWIYENGKLIKNPKAVK